jgi:LL-diaminopimelate aminotransferase
VPDGYTSVEYAAKLLDEVAVVVTPGVGYGQQGEGYIRLTLTVPDERIDEALNRIGSLSS